MIQHGFKLVLVSAVMTMAVTLAVCGTGRLDAVGPESQAEIMPVINQPTLEIDGLHVKLTMDRDHYAVGEEPIVTLDVTNPTDKRVVTRVWVGMTASSVQSLLSRVPVLPEYVWSESVPLAIEPGATEHFQFNTGRKMLADQTVSVTMSERDQQPAMAKLLDVRGSQITVPNH